MSPIIRNILAVIAGLFIGGIVNSGIIALGPNLISPPAGVDPNDIASIKANVDAYGIKDFIVPFLAHGLGTLIGAFVAAKIGITKQRRLTFVVAILFLIGGILMAFMIPEFWMFSIVDLVGAYFPMAYIGWKLAGAKNAESIASK